MAKEVDQTGPSVGRPTLCTPEAVEGYCKGLRLHLPQHLCATLAGVSADTVQIWFKRGADGEEPYASFVRRAAQTKAHMAGRLTRRIARAGQSPREWRASLALFDRMYLDAPPIQMPLGPLPVPVPGSNTDGITTAEDLTDPERMALNRIQRIQGALAAAQGAHSHVAASQLGRDLDKAVGELAELRKAARTSPADQDEETFLELLAGAAEQMPELHIRCIVDAYCRRHRVALIRDHRWKRDESGQWYLEEDQDQIETEGA